MISQETEFARRRDLPGVEVRYFVSASRTQDIILTLRGNEIGWCTKVFKRNRLVSAHYILPTLDSDNNLSV